MKTADETAVVVALVGTTMMVELEGTGGIGTTVVEVGATAAGVVEVVGGTGAGVVEMGGATGTVGGATVVVGCSLKVMNGVSFSY